jgi:cyclopropane-fatty-acyl-phospholipid synthase
MSISTRESRSTRARAERPELRLHSEPEPGSIAEAVLPLLTRLLGAEPRVRVELWDGSALGRVDAIGTLVVRSPDALRRILWAPGELGVGRAYVAGDLDVEGDVLEVLAELRDVARDRLEQGILPVALRAARRAKIFGRPPTPPPEEATMRGRRHSKARDAAAISHHYDVGNDFYEIVLGEAMTYSCAYFPDRSTSLAAAQAAKHELVCRKLGLHERPGARLLDVGCGWGSMAMHAAREHGAEVVAVTISEQQATMARDRVVAAGLGDQVQVRLQDYRDLSSEAFDAISSIGMFEHVGKARMGQYFDTLRGLLRPEGRLLNHAISSVGGSRLDRRSFAGRYVFPDGELLDVADVVRAMEDAGFEVRDVEGLREHYARTLQAWIANLESQWDRAASLVGEGRARVWRLYMAASALGFEDGGLGLHQVLGVATSPSGTSGMPRTRDRWSVRA